MYKHILKIIIFFLNKYSLFRSSCMLSITNYVQPARPNDLMDQNPQPHTASDLWLYSRLETTAHPQRTSII